MASEILVKINVESGKAEVSLGKAKKGVDKLASSTKKLSDLQEETPDYKVFSIDPEGSIDIDDAFHFKCDNQIEVGIDYLTSNKDSAKLMRRYAAFSLMVANDVQEKVYIYDDEENSGWNIVSYRTFKSTGSNDSSALEDMLRSLK